MYITSEKMRNLSRAMETVRRNQMQILEENQKNITTVTKTSFGALNSRLSLPKRSQ